MSRTKEYFRSLEQKFSLGTFTPRNECTWGTFVPGSKRCGEYTFLV